MHYRTMAVMLAGDALRFQRIALSERGARVLVLGRQLDNNPLRSKLFHSEALATSGGNG